LDKQSFISLNQRVIEFLALQNLTDDEENARASADSITDQEHQQDHVQNVEYLAQSSQDDLP